MYNKNLKNTLQIQYHKIHITIKKKILIHKINQNKNYLMINNYISKMKVFFSILLYYVKQMKSRE